MVEASTVGRPLPKHSHQFFFTARVQGSSSRRLARILLYFMAALPSDYLMLSLGSWKDFLDKNATSRHPLRSLLLSALRLQFWNGNQHCTSSLQRTVTPSDVRICLCRLPRNTGHERTWRLFSSACPCSATADAKRLLDSTSKHCAGLALSHRRYIERSETTVHFEKGLREASLIKRTSGQSCSSALKCT